MSIEILADTVVGETQYFRHLLKTVGPFVNTPPVNRMRYVRYDTSGTVVFLDSISTDPLVFSYDPIYPTRNPALYHLRTNFGDTIFTPGAIWGDFMTVSGGYGGQVWIDNQSYAVAARKSLYALYAAGIGLVYHAFFDGPQVILDYAQISGHEFAAPLEVLLTSTEDPQEIPSDISLSIYPNPAQSRVFLRFQTALAAEGAFHLYDVLGRQVQAGFSGRWSPGVHTYDLDLSGLSPGPYYLVVTTGAGRQVISPITKLR